MRGATGLNRCERQHGVDRVSGLFCETLCLGHFETISLLRHHNGVDCLLPSSPQRYTITYLGKYEVHVCGVEVLSKQITVSTQLLEASAVHVAHRLQQDTQIEIITEGCETPAVVPPAVTAGTVQPIQLSTPHAHHYPESCS